MCLVMEIEALEGTDMTTTLLAMSIAAIFSGWVWTLKQELKLVEGQLGEMASGRRLAVANGVAHEPVAHILAKKQVEPEEAMAAASGNGVRSHRSMNGVQTFVIDG